MGMNNIYYRFLHLVEDAEYQQLPARLRMNVLANPGIDKQDFELLSLAVSAINGCGTCVASHERQLRQHGMSREGVQSAVRIAATLHGQSRACWSLRRRTQAWRNPTRPDSHATRLRVPPFRKSAMLAATSSRQRLSGFLGGPGDMGRQDQIRDGWIDQRIAIDWRLLRQHVDRPRHRILPARSASTSAAESDQPAARRYSPAGHRAS